MGVNKDRGRYLLSGCDPMKCEFCENDMKSHWSNGVICICSDCFDTTRDTGGIKEEDIDEASL